MADVIFKTVLERLEAGMDGLGFAPSPLPLETPKPRTLMDRGWSAEFPEIANTGAYSDRERAEVRIGIDLHVSHVLRPFPEDGRTDVVVAATDHLRIIAALMQDPELNALGMLSFGKWAVKRSKTGEWVEGKIRITLQAEIAYPLWSG